jgi:hypothetical protein
MAAFARRLAIFAPQGSTIGFARGLGILSLHSRKIRRVEKLRRYDNIRCHNTTIVVVALLVKFLAENSQVE